jgi:heme/copper-type cytochrome/quinol oxidase subunit 2
MAATERVTLGIGHPAPHRQAARPLLFLFALLGAPAAWLVELLIGFAVTSYTCDMHQTRGALAAVPGWVWPLITVVNLLALLIAALALIAGVVLIRQTRGEHQTRSGEPIDAGEGRTRVLAVWAIVGSIIFIVALLTNTFSLSLVSICRP